MGIKKIDNLIQQGVNLITLPRLSADDLKETLEVCIKQWLMLPEKLHAMDFSNIEALDQNSLTQILSFQKSLRKVEKDYFCINLNPVLQRELKDRGVFSSFQLKTSFNEGVKMSTPPTAKKTQVDANLLKPFIDGATKAFEVQVGLALRPGTPSSKNYLFEKEDVLAGQVTVELPAFKGMISLCFTGDSFFAVYEALLGEKIDQINDENADAASELLNMIYGHAKTILNQKFGMTLQPAIPKTVISPQPAKSTHPVIVVPFESDKGKLRIEIVIY